MTGKANNIFSGPRSVVGHQNPGELPRLDVTYVRFYGNAERMNAESGRAIWRVGQEVLAVAYGCHDHWLRNFYYQQSEVVGEQSQARI